MITDTVTAPTSAPAAPTARRRRRTPLTPIRSIPVGYTGDRGGEGPLTLGQLNTYMWLSETPDHALGKLWVEFPVPAAATVDDLAEAVSRLIARHESLRTTIVPGEPPLQRIAAAGVQMLEVCSLGAGQWGPQDRPAAAEALTRWLRESAAPGWRALRVAVAVAPDAGERVIACAAGFTHLVVDHAAIEILKRDFADLLADPAPRPPDRAQHHPQHQPLDQAELEATPAGRRRAEAALDYLREQSRRIPRCMYALPGARPSGESLAVELSSSAAATAVRQVAARTRASRSSVVLAAVCAVVAHRADYPDLVFPLISGNRFERRLTDYVGTLAQGSIATLEIAGRSFDELVARAWIAMLEASRHAAYDGSKRAAADELIEQERGLRFNYDPFFNSLVPEPSSPPTAATPRPEEVDAAPARTELRWRPMPTEGSPIRFSLNQIDGRLRLDAWSADIGLLPRGELESVLMAVERLLAAAEHGDVPGARIPEAIGLDRIARTEDRIMVDSCWVEVADVQRLLDEAVGPGRAHVFAEVEGRPLVAHLAGAAGVRTPEEAHARCMAALTHHPTAITPRHYVICDSAPSASNDPSAWLAPLAAGTGRQHQSDESKVKL